MNKYLGLVLLVVLCSCKATKPVVVANNTNADTKIAPAKIIDGHYAENRNFVTAYIKASVKYEDSKNKQNVSAEIRIKKNEMILVSVRVLGITMAKALLTPAEVKYYEKINGNYFEGDYAMLSRWLGTDLDFEKVQNLLIGQAMDNLKQGNYATSTQGNLYQLESQGQTIKQFLFEPDHFWLRAQKLNQPSQERSLQVLYPDYRPQDSVVFPTELNITAQQPKGKTTIDVTISSVEINQPMTFPYSVPSGYEKIEIND